MSREANRLVFSRVWPRRPLDPHHLQRLLARLASDPSSPWLVLETRATAAGIAHLIGVHPPQVPWLHHLLHDLFLGIALSTKPETIDRPPCHSAADIAFRPDSLMLDDGDPVALTTVVLSALHAPLHEGETLVLQYLLGPRRGGQHLHPDAMDPHQPVASRLTRGVRPPSPGARAQIEDRLRNSGFLTTIRVGASANNPTVERQRLATLGGALATARSTGVRLSARRLSPTTIDNATTPRRWRQRLSPSELTGLLAWPIGDHELPGVPPIHPRLLLPSRTPTETMRVFGATALPGTATPVGVSPADGLLHEIHLGPTGSGKSNALLPLIAADAAAGRPLLVIDPKRQLVDDIVDRCIPAHRIDDVVIYDAARSDGPLPGFNPLDVGDRNPDVIVDGQLAVLKAMFHDGWGPRTEDIFLAGLLTLARAGRHNAEPYTWLDLPRLLTESAFRRRVLAQTPLDDTLSGFWAAYDDLTPAAQSAIIAAPMNKLRRYLLRPAVRAILGQPAPRFHLRDMFRQNKIVLIPLNDALIGTITAELIGSLIVAEAWLAAQERASETRPMDRPGYVIVDECQRFVHLPLSFSDALSQSRSYGVGWLLAHQQRSQLPNDLADAIDSNARNKLVFRLESAKDAAVMAKLAPGLDPEDFQQLPRYHAYARVMVGGESSGWHTVVTNPPPAPTGLGERIRQRSRELYGGFPPATTNPPRPIGGNRAEESDIPVGKKRRTSTGPNDAVPEGELI